MRYSWTKIGCMIAGSLIMMNVSIASHSDQHITQRIHMSANKIHSLANKQETALEGKVKLAIGKKIKISTDNAIVKYTDKKHQHVAEFIMHGNGVLSKEGRVIAFKDAKFNPNTSTLSAIQLTQVQ